MAKTKIAITLDESTLRRVDGLVRAARYRNRSQAIEAAVKAELGRLDRNRLAEECAKLDPAEENAPCRKRGSRPTVLHGRHTEG